MALANEEEIARLTQNVIEEFRTLGRVTPGTAKALHDAQTEIENFNFKIEAGGKFLSKMGDAVANTTKAMYRGEKGASAFNQSVGDMADAAQIAAVGLSLLIPGGPVMKAVVAGLTYLGTSALKAGSELVQTANKQSDSLYGAFQKMSKAGAAGSDGLTGVFGDIQKLGLGIQDLDGYVNMINESSQDLAMFRGSVAAGRRAFADMNQEMKPFTQQLYNAGLSQEEIAAGAMGYLKIQTMIGQAQTKTTAELAQGAKKYLIEQDALTKLTGQTRQQAEAARAKAESEQRFRAVVESMRNSGDKQQQAAAEELVRANQVLSSQSEEAGQGFRDLTTGMITTEAGLKAYNSSNGEALSVATDMRAGNINAIDGVQKMAKAFGANAESLNSLAQTGVYEDFGIKFADAVKLGNLAMNDLTEMFKKVVAEQEKQGVTGKKALDDLQQTQTEIRELQRDTMLLTQAFVQEAVGPATDAMKKLAQAANAAAEALLKSQTPSAKEARKLSGTEGDIYTGGAMSEEARGGEAKYVSLPAGAKAPPAPVPLNAQGKTMSLLEQARASTESAKTNNAQRQQTVAAPAAPAASSASPVTLPMTSGGPKSQAPAAPAQQQPVTSYSERLLNYIKRTEQFRETAFWDSQQWTNGYGTKAKSPTGGMEDKGPRETIDESTAMSRMTDFLQNAVSNVISYSKKYGYNWNQGQVDALTSFSYNAGIGALDQLTADGKRSNEEIAAKILQYNKAKNSKTGEREVLPGLTSRRQEELSMFKGARDGGMFDGPNSGYPMTLHGPEAVIPLKNGMVPVSMNDNGVNDSIKQLITKLSNNISIVKLDQLTVGNKSNNEEITAKILKYNTAQDEKTKKIIELSALTQRRQEELSMFRQKQYDRVDNMPKSSYPANSHDLEDIIPLKNGMVPVTINPTGLLELMPSLEIDRDTADQISESFKTGMNVDFSAMVASLGELVQQQQNQNNTGLQEKMISLLEDIRSSQVSTADHTGRMAAVASN